jgi:hypothetical protein
MSDQNDSIKMSLLLQELNSRLRPSGGSRIFRQSIVWQNVKLLVGLMAFGLRFQQSHHLQF